MKITTWNVNSLKVRMGDVEEYIENEGPDAILLQELKADHPNFPMSAFFSKGYKACWHGQPTYNGVAIVSLKSPEEITRGIPGYSDEAARVITARYEDLLVMSLYAVNGESVESPKFSYKMEFYDRLIDYVGELVAKNEKLVIGGDFNIAPADIDSHDPEFFGKEILSTPKEREIFQRLLDLGLIDVLRTVAGPEETIYTWFDYRGRAFEQRLGARIDHFLATPKAFANIRAAGVDLSYRAKERPSDHAPVWIDYDWR